MLGFGIAKLFLTLAVIAIAWFTAKRFTRIGPRTNAQRRPSPDRRPANGAPAANRGSTRVEETVQCSRCGDYLPARRLRSCGREGCPYSC